MKVFLLKFISKLMLTKTKMENDHSLKIYLIHKLLSFPYITLVNSISSCLPKTQNGNKILSFPNYRDHKNIIFLKVKIYITTAVTALIFSFFCLW